MCELNRRVPDFVPNPNRNLLVRKREKLSSGSREGNAPTHLHPSVASPSQSNPRAPRRSAPPGRPRTAARQAWYHMARTVLRMAVCSSRLHRELCGCGGCSKRGTWGRGSQVSNVTRTEGERVKRTFETLLCTNRQTRCVHALNGMCTDEVSRVVGARESRWALESRLPPPRCHCRSFDWR